MNKYFLTISFFLLSLTTFSQQRNKQSLKKKITEQVITFSGNWSYSDKNSEFNLFLNQKGKSIIGSHCSIMRNGNRIDCAEDSTDSITITGSIVNPNTATVEFRSTFSDKIGKAKITRSSRTKIKWEIIKEPNGEYYIPKMRILSKQ
ncbi:MAG TPA: hypothetical protein VMY77_03315 [Chitinophagaceae bacterium]|nr:hypothetical protein [Chitinophagaceae bacterium]